MSFISLKLKEHFTFFLGGDVKLCLYKNIIQFNILER